MPGRHCDRKRARACGGRKTGQPRRRASASRTGSGPVRPRMRTMRRSFHEVSDFPLIVVSSIGCACGRPKRARHAGFPGGVPSPCVGDPARRAGCRPMRQEAPGGAIPIPSSRFHGAREGVDVEALRHGRRGDGASPHSAQEGGDPMMRAHDIRAVHAIPAGRNPLVLSCRTCPLSMRTPASGSTMSLPACPRMSSHAMTIHPHGEQLRAVLFRHPCPWLFPDRFHQSRNLPSWKEG